MSLYADICKGYHANEHDLTFDESTNTWTVNEGWGVEAIPGIADKELALAIARAIYAAWNAGGDNAVENASYS